MIPPSTPPSSGAFDAVTVTLNPAVDVTITLPGFRQGHVNRAESLVSCPGGKGVNVAATLADYGLHLAATGFLGKENSALFVDHFVEKRIADYFYTVPGQTRSGIKIVDPVRRETTDVNLPGAAIGSTEFFRLRGLLRKLDAAWFVLSGSLPPGAPADAYAVLLKDLKARGVQVALDASGDALRQALAEPPAVLKPNLAELGELVGERLETPDDAVDAARLLLADGVGTVAVSMGEQGACFVSREEAVIAVPPPVTVHSTVGAGDAMVAGIVAA
ncbi:MAG TPA: 1-phosphofructokinase family hexose kinase, partial [Candidatus Methylacidiphilales bacterium]